MKEIKILHLYSELLDLYGDFSNISIIKQKAEEIGVCVEIKEKQLGDAIVFEDYDLLYIGHGKCRNLTAVAEHFLSYQSEILKFIENDNIVLSFGNSRELFGKTFEGHDQQIHKGLALFDYTSYETGDVFVSDVLGYPISNANIQTYGFINRTAHIMGNNSYHLFHVSRGYGDDKIQNEKEGNRYKNFFGTWQMGPFLVRNPLFLREILMLLLKDDFREFDYELEQEALRRTLNEFEKRA